MTLSVNASVNSAFINIITMTNNRVLLIKRLCIALEVLPTTQEKKAENLHSQVVKPHFSRCGKSSPKCFHFETSRDFLGHLAVKKWWYFEKVLVWDFSKVVFQPLWETQGWGEELVLHLICSSSFLGSCSTAYEAKLMSVIMEYHYCPYSLTRRKTGSSSSRANNTWFFFLWQLL